MKKATIVVVLSLVLSVSYCYIFYSIFASALIENNLDKVGSNDKQNDGSSIVETVCVNQLGVFNDKVNADELINRIESIKENAYVYKKNDAIIVLGHISTNSSSCLAYRNFLTNSGFNNFIKEYQVNNSEIVNAIAKEDYESFLRYLEIEN